jgi:UDPglucose--hexose-1-phosphate uridylyltransferase
MEDTLKKNPHRRFNALTGEWILVSPQRWERPWQGKMEVPANKQLRQYDPECYLCPGNKRANGETNPDYENTYIFNNDFSAILPEPEEGSINKDNLFVASVERGICRVVCFSPRHDKTLADMNTGEIEDVVKTWIKEFNELAGKEFINNILIFENKGELMGNSNPHPHCQIWAQENIPTEVYKENLQQSAFHEEKGKCLLCSYLKSEEEMGERIIFSNKDFAVVVPFWAEWPYETLILSRRHIKNISELNSGEIKSFAELLGRLTGTYDRLFNTPFPYSAGIHQAPVDGKEHKGWHFHMHFFPPLLRSATVKKFMVGYEMLGNPQRDITPEYAAERLREIK